MLAPENVILEQAGSAMPRIPHASMAQAGPLGGHNNPQGV